MSMTGKTLPIEARFLQSLVTGACMTEACAFMYSSLLYAIIPYNMYFHMDSILCEKCNEFYRVLQNFLTTFLSFFLNFGDEFRDIIPADPGGLAPNP